jgi:hypothetical protein
LDSSPASVRPPESVRNAGPSGVNLSRFLSALIDAAMMRSIRLEHSLSIALLLGSVAPGGISLRKLKSACSLLVVIWFSSISTDVIGGAASYRHAAEKIVFVAIAPTGQLASRSNTSVFVPAMSSRCAREHRAIRMRNTSARAVELGPRD